MTENSDNFAQEWRIQLDGQTPYLRLNGKWNVYDFTDENSSFPQTFLSIVLEGGAIAADVTGKMTNNRDDKRGYYTESAQVTMSLEDRNASLYADGPQTTTGSSATTSSTAIGVNVGAGTFAAMPTTSASFGLTIGSSFTRDLSDFKVQNNSTLQQLVHNYQLATTTGGTYNSANDLPDTSSGGYFKGCPLFRLPDLAVSNLPIMSQGIWIVDSKKAIDTAVNIHVVHHLVRVEKTFEFSKVKLNIQRYTITRDYRLPIPMGAHPALARAAMTAVAHEEHQALAAESFEQTLAQPQNANV